MDQVVWNGAPFFYLQKEPLQLSFINHMLAMALLTKITIHCRTESDKICL